MRRPLAPLPPLRCPLAGAVLRRRLLRPLPLLALAGGRGLRRVLVRAVAVRVLPPLLPVRPPRRAKRVRLLHAGFRAALWVVLVVHPLTLDLLVNER